jgi:hypothetical protein
VIPLPKWIEDGEPWRRELDAPKRVTDDEVGVEPPTQLAVEALGAIDVRYRDDDDLELHVDRLRSGGLACSFAGHLGSVHVELLRFGSNACNRELYRAVSAVEGESVLQCNYDGCDTTFLSNDRSLR